MAPILRVTHMTYTPKYFVQSLTHWHLTMACDDFDRACMCAYTWRAKGQKVVLARTQHLRDGQSQGKY